jgi:hypothetical protein
MQLRAKESREIKEQKKMHLSLFPSFGVFLRKTPKKSIGLPFSFSTFSLSNVKRGVRNILKCPFLKFETLRIHSLLIKKLFFQKMK